MWPTSGKAISCSECARTKKKCPGNGAPEKAPRKRAAPTSDKGKKRARVVSDSEEEADPQEEVLKELRELRKAHEAQAKELQKLKREVKEMRADDQADRDYVTEEWRILSGVVRRMDATVTHIFCFMENMEDKEPEWVGGVEDSSEGVPEGVSEGSDVDMEEAAREVALEMGELQAEEAEALASEQGSAPA